MNRTDSRAMELGRRAAAARWRWLQILLLAKMTPDQLSLWFSSKEGEAMAERIEPTQPNCLQSGELPAWRKRGASIRPELQAGSQQPRQGFFRRLIAVIDATRSEK